MKNAVYGIDSIMRVSWQLVMRTRMRRAVPSQLRASRAGGSGGIVPRKLLRTDGGHCFESANKNSAITTSVSPRSQTARSYGPIAQRATPFFAACAKSSCVAEMIRVVSRSGRPALSTRTAMSTVPSTLALRIIGGNLMATAGGKSRSCACPTRAVATASASVSGPIFRASIPETIRRFVLLRTAGECSSARS